LIFKGILLIIYRMPISSAHPVKLFIGMLSRETALFEKLKDVLQKIFGTVDMMSPVWPWEHTDYYEKEMGAWLKRQFVFFQDHIQPEDIVEIKLKTIEMEKGYLNENNGRRINLDPGYLDMAKIVLVSTKDFSHRIYLGSGIYGEVTLLFSGGDYQVLPYTFPDFRTGEYCDVFKKAREIYKIDAGNKRKNR
jgi:hypothetical protein